MRTHTHTNMHTSKRAHEYTQTSISWCPLELSEVKGHAFIFIWFGCLEISNLFPPRERPPRPQIALSFVEMLHTHPFYLISPLPFLSLCLFCCLALDFSTISALASLPSSPLLVHIVIRQRCQRTAPYLHGAKGTNPKD